MKSAKDLSACMAGVLRAYVHHFNRRYGFVGHLWQGRFKSPAVDVEPYFLSCARYIERNPVAAGLVAAPWDYAWSSSPAYALGKADPLLAYNVWYRELGKDASNRQRRWDQVPGLAYSAADAEKLRGILDGARYYAAGPRRNIFDVWDGQGNTQILSFFGFFVHYSWPWVL